jgi:hypothetical protein
MADDQTPPAASQPLRPNPTIDRSVRRGRPQDDELLLASPPREPEWTRSDPWRVLRIMGEIVEGFDALAGICPAVTIFGSARTPETDPAYTAARQTARRLAESGFAIITGGGPGIMAAANRGACEGGAVSGTSR